MYINKNNQALGSSSAEVPSSETFHSEIVTDLKKGEK
jgi:hypothetical protein